jgi:hypothetical protein
MKGKIFKLIFSVILFSTSPLFSIPNKDEVGFSSDKQTTTSHVKHAHSANSNRNENGDTQNGNKTNIVDLPPDMILQIFIGDGDIQTAITASLASKKMYRIVQKPFVLCSMAKLGSIYINNTIGQDISEIKQQIKNHFDLFTDIKKTYTIPVSHLQFFLEHFNKNWDIPIGAGHLLRRSERFYFKTFCGANNGLDCLPPDTPIIFTFNKDFGGFQSIFYVDKRIRKLVDRSTLEHEPWFSQPSSASHAINNFGFISACYEPYCSEQGKQKLKILFRK